MKRPMELEPQKPQTRARADNGRPVTATRLREQAARARRLSQAWLTEADQRLLEELADRLESEAADLERGDT
jgi:hypothetical protein